MLPISTNTHSKLALPLPPACLCPRCCLCPPLPGPQITALIFLPSFPGWLAPLAFNPVRFLEFFSFAATLLGTWVASGEWGGRLAQQAGRQAVAARAQQHCGCVHCQDQGGGACERPQPGPLPRCCCALMQAC